jgi:hypothetical protein
MWGRTVLRCWRNTLLEDSPKCTHQSEGRMPSEWVAPAVPAWIEERLLAEA